MNKTKNLKIMPKTPFCSGTHISHPTEGFKHNLDFLSYDSPMVYMDGFLNDGNENFI